MPIPASSAKLSVVGSGTSAINPFAAANASSAAQSLAGNATSAPLGGRIDSTMTATTSTPLRAVLRNPAILLGGWLILLEACTVGATGTLLPLRLARFGAPAWAIGATFVLASLLSAALSPTIGRLVDRRGARLPLCAGLASGRTGTPPLPRHLG